MRSGRQSAAARLATVALALFSFTSGLLAQSAGLGLNPSRLEVEVSPGSEKTIGFEIESPPSGTVVRGRLLLSATDWSINEDAAVVYADPGTLPKSASNWIVYSPSAVSIASGQKQLVRVTVTVPATANPGVYRTAIFVQERPPATPPKPGERLLYIRLRYVFTLYVIVGEVAGDGQLNNVEIVYSRTSPQVILDMSNSGDRHVRPIISWVIRDASQKEVASLSKHEAMVVLPNARLKQAFPVPVQLPAGRYELSAQADFQDGRPIQLLRRVVEITPPAPATAPGTNTPSTAPPER